MKQIILSLTLLLSVSTISLANKPTSYVSGKIVKDKHSEMVYLKISKFNTIKEKVLVRFSDKDGKTLKTVKLTTSHYTTVKKLDLQGISYENLKVEIVKK